MITLIRNLIGRMHGPGVVAKIDTVQKYEAFRALESEAITLRNVMAKADPSRWRPTPDEPSAEMLAEAAKVARRKGQRERLLIRAQVAQERVERWRHARDAGYSSPTAMEHDKRTAILDRLNAINRANAEANFPSETAQRIRFDDRPTSVHV